VPCYHAPVRVRGEACAKTLLTQMRKPSVPPLSSRPCWCSTRSVQCLNKLNQCIDTRYSHWHVLVVVQWEGLATVEQHGGYAQCHHHAPLSALLSAVHPVTLYTHTQPSTAQWRAPLQAASSVRLSQPPRPCHCLSPQRCNVYDAPYTQRYWCSSDAVHTRGT
jgi:hypothetical protein